MQFRTFGKTKSRTSIIGFGTWGIGGITPGATSYGHISDEEAISTIKEALSNQITLYDTSCVYGNSERLLGKLLPSCRDDVIIATKGGIKSYDSPLDFSPESLTESLTGSLKRLNTSYVDVFQLHNPPRDIFHKTPGLAQYLDSEISNTRASQIGISVKSPEDAFELFKHYEFSTVQVNLNMLDVRAIDSGLLDYCQSKNIGVLVRTPLCFGFLSKTINENSKFSGNDHRSRWSYEQKKIWSDGAILVHDICSKFETNSEHFTPAMNAIRFCFNHPAVSSVLTGPVKSCEVRDNAKTGSLPLLNSDVYDAIIKINAEYSFFHNAQDNESNSSINPV